MSKPAPPNTNKLTQAQRSALSKQKLIEATVESLIQQGYAQTSTQEICQRAGLSKGGLFRQFATRGELMIETAGYLYETLMGQFEAHFAEHDGSHRAKAENTEIQQVVRWVRENFNSPLFQAALELTIASRTDAVLKEGMVPVIKKNTGRILSVAKLLYPKAANANPRFEAVIHLLVLAFQGEVIDALVYNSEALADQRFELLVDIAERELG